MYYVNLSSSFLPVVIATLLLIVKNVSCLQCISCGYVDIVLQPKNPADNYKTYTATNDWTRLLKDISKDISSWTPQCSSVHSISNNGLVKTCSSEEACGYARWNLNAPDFVDLNDLSNPKYNAEVSVVTRGCYNLNLDENIEFCDSKHQHDDDLSQQSRFGDVTRLFESSIRGHLCYCNSSFCNSDLARTTTTTYTPRSQGSSSQALLMTHINIKMFTLVLLHIAWRMKL